MLDFWACMCIMWASQQTTLITMPITPPLTRQITTLLHGKKRQLDVGLYAHDEVDYSVNVRPILFSTICNERTPFKQHFQITLAACAEHAKGGFHYDGDSCVVQLTTMYPVDAGDFGRLITETNLYLTIWQEKFNGIELPKEYKLLEKSVIHVQSVDAMTMKSLLKYLVSWEALKNVKGNEAYKTSLTPEILASINQEGKVLVQPVNGFFGLYHEDEEFSASPKRIYRAAEYFAAVPDSKLSHEEVETRISLFNDWRAVMTGSSTCNVIEEIGKFADMVEACPVDIEEEGTHLSEEAKSLAKMTAAERAKAIYPDPAMFDAWMELVDFCNRELECHEYLVTLGGGSVYTVDSLTWRVGTSINSYMYSFIW